MAMRNGYDEDEAMQRKETSTLPDLELFERLQCQFKEDDEHSREWRDGARQNYDFYAGRQWDEKDISKLKDENRPVITFNRTLTIVKAVAGIEINGRHDTVFLPRETESEEIKANEILTAASQWMADECDAEDEQSEAFQDTLITGMGWTEIVVNFDEEADGKYVETKIDPMEMRWDKNARAKNLADAKRLFRAKKMPLKAAMDMFPDTDPDDIDAYWASETSSGENKSREEKRKRNTPMNGGGETHSSMVTIVHAQWIEREPYYRVAVPKIAVNHMTGQPQIAGYEEVEMTPAEWKDAKKQADEQGLQIEGVKQHRRVFKQAFLGAEGILGEVEAGPCGDNYSWNCITGERDHNKGYWFGLIDLMKDPQRWANKWLSQTLHILNSTAKGGIIAEKGAFDDVREAQRTYAKPDSITTVKDGAIAGNKIMQKPGQGIAAPYFQALEFAISSIRDSVGVNLELLGMRDANQPGILEAHRKQAGMTILATLFDSLRRFRKRVGRGRLFFIQEYFSDGRIIRVTGPEGMKSMRLIKDRTLGKYDVVIDDAPTSPNQREQNWFVIQQLFPVFKDMLTPEAVVVLLEYSPLPSQVTDAFKTMLNKEPTPEEQEQKALAQRGALAKVAGEEAKAAQAQTTAIKNRAAAILDMANAAVAQQKVSQVQAETARTNREVNMEDLLRQVQALAADLVQEPESGLPFPPHVPTMPVQPGVDLSAVPVQVVNPIGQVDGYGNPIN